MATSRRAFIQLVGLNGLAAAAAPAARLDAAQPLGAPGTRSSTIRLSSNENSSGPGPRVMAAIEDAFSLVNRYNFRNAHELGGAIAPTAGVGADNVVLGCGSSEILDAACLAFLRPDLGLLTASPTFELVSDRAEQLGILSAAVPVDSQLRLDLTQMAERARGKGLIYVCNPNNPTGTITPRADIEWLIANKPEETVLLLDEAYIHLTDEPVCSDLVAMDKDVIILRTFSKLYGMAGLRAGAAMGRPDLIGKLRSYGAGALPMTGMVGAAASLKVKNLVPERRRIVKDVREEVFAFLQKNNITFVPSVSNCFMLDAKMPARRLVDAMKKEKVYIGRVWPAWPTHARVSVGTKEEMARFKTALLKVMSGLQV
jgi:histidinol-phosphate aminotransferase